MIWLSTDWDSHSTQLQGPTGRFDGQFIKSKICFQPGVMCRPGKSTPTFTTYSKQKTNQTLLTEKLNHRH